MMYSAYKLNNEFVDASLILIHIPDRNVICVRNNIGPLVLNGSNAPYLKPNNSKNNSATQSSKSALSMWSVLATELLSTLNVANVTEQLNFYLISFKCK